jgi:hypothetical protein
MASRRSQSACSRIPNSDREFAARPFLRLEVLPQATFNKRKAEAAFYDAFLSAVSRWATDLSAITEAA